MGTSLDPLDDGGFPELRPHGLPRVQPPAGVSDDDLGGLRAACYGTPTSTRGRHRPGPGRGRGGAGARRRAAAAALPEHPARRRAARCIHDLGDAKLVERLAGRSWRSPSAPTWPAPCASTTCCTRSSTRSRSSASTTSSARRRRRTSWPSVRQRPVRADLEPGPHRPRADRRARDPGASTTASRFYEATGAFRDMVVTHLFQILAFMAMEPPTALRAARDQRGEEQGLPVACARST